MANSVRNDNHIGQQLEFLHPKRNALHSPNSHIGQCHLLYIQHHESVDGVFDGAGYLAACSAVITATLGTVINFLQMRDCQP
jgi:hypothetical protein